MKVQYLFDPEISTNPPPAKVIHSAPCTKYDHKSHIQKPKLTIFWAKHLDEVREAQKLRYEVFAKEMGAILPVIIPGHDVDIFDDFCEHLLVKRLADGQVIGTYRVLTPVQAKLAGKLYSDNEFDLTPLRAFRPHMVELGRSCVHKDFRQGTVMMALWGALVDFMLTNRLSFMVGCASIPMTMNLGDGNLVCARNAAASIWRRLCNSQHMAQLVYQVTPHLPLPVDHPTQTLDIDPPALIKGYLRLGAKVLGAPAWDPDFNSADLPMMMNINDLPSRYRKHFLG